MNISFIIPIYNTPEQKLLNCLNSFNNLQNLEYEVVLIDDGSDSYIQEICDQYTKNSDVFCYYRKTNGGVSEARNFGIRKAKGDYIAFVDADDYIIPSAYTRDIISIDSEIILFDLIVKNKTEERICALGNAKMEGFYNVEMLFSAFFNDSRIGGPVAKLFKRDFLVNNGLKFDTKMIVAEDADFLCCIIDKMNTIGKRCYYVNLPAYVYDYSPITNDTRIKRNPPIVLNNYLHISNKKIELINKLSFDLKLKKIYLRKTNNSIIHTLYSFTAVLISNGSLTPKIEAEIIEATNELRMKFKTFQTSKTLSSNYYLWCLSHRHWKLIKIYVLMKAVYRRILIN